jgi:hypothetical protein
LKPYKDINNKKNAVPSPKTHSLLFSFIGLITKNTAQHISLITLHLSQQHLHLYHPLLPTTPHILAAAVIVSLGPV